MVEKGGCSGKEGSSERKEEASSLESKRKWHTCQNLSMHQVSCYRNKTFTLFFSYAYAFGVSVSLVEQCVAHQIINNGSNKWKQQTDAEDTIITSNKQRTQVWTADHYFNKQQQLIHWGEQLTADELKVRFSTLMASQLQQCRSGDEQMIMLLIIIDTEIA